MTVKTKIILASVLAVVLIAAVVLALVLTAERYTVTFESNGGTAVESVKGVAKDSKLTRPENPTKLDYVLEGWYTDSELTKLWLFDVHKVTGNLKLYAKWKIAYTANLSYTLNSDNTYSVSKGTAVDTDVVIPHYYQGLAVTKISSNGFSGYSALKSVTLSDTVTSVGMRAFYRCTGLTKVVLPKSLQIIETDAFGYCEKLENIAFPAGLKQIGDHAFSDCKTLKEINLPNGIETIGTYAFRNCAAVTSVVLPDSVERIMPYIFSGCSALTEVTLGSGTKNLDYNALDGCPALTKVTYKGTKEQWSKINELLKDSWKGNSPVEKVVCLDGEIDFTSKDE